MVRNSQWVVQLLVSIGRHELTLTFSRVLVLHTQVLPTQVLLRRSRVYIIMFQPEVAQDNPWPCGVNNSFPLGPIFKHGRGLQPQVKIWIYTRERRRLSVTQENVRVSSWRPIETSSWTTHCEFQTMDSNLIVF